MKFPSLDMRLRLALQEDSAFHDATTLQIPGINKDSINAKIIAKQSGVFCGGFLIPAVMKILDPTAQVKIVKKEGSFIKAGQIAAKIRGKAAAVFAGERLILNLICHLSGVATLTWRFTQAVKGTGAAIVDTRKTTPLWRDLEKHAVLCGGGKNHRFSLGDAILAKDNHLHYLRHKEMSPSLVFGSAAFLKNRRNGLKFIAMEAGSVPEVWEAIKAKCDIILLDNMASDQIKRSLVLIKAARKAFNSAHPLAEVSGGVSLSNVKNYARLGVDRISVGALTHSAPVLDLSLEVS